MYVVARMLANK